MLGTGRTSCVQVYFDNESLILLNHANDGNFGSIGFERIKTDDQKAIFANFLKKLVKKINENVQNNHNITEIKLIGCDVSPNFAQDIANLCQLRTRTLPDIHPKYDQYGSGDSVLTVSKDNKQFWRGFIFDSEPNQSFFNQNRPYIEKETNNLPQERKRPNKEEEEHSSSVKKYKIIVRLK